MGFLELVAGLYVIKLWRCTAIILHTHSCKRRTTKQSPGLFLPLPAPCGCGKRCCFSPVRARHLNKQRIPQGYPLFVGAGGRTRTGDLRITNALLYQLSHTSIFNYEFGFRNSELLIITAADTCTDAERRSIRSDCQ